MTLETPLNAFSMDTYASIIKHALEHSYKFVTLREFVKLGCPDKHHFVIRHDVDRCPLALEHIVDVEASFGIASTTYVRVAGAEYNPFSYPAFKVFKAASEKGTEIGLHTSFYEFSKINNVDPLQILEGEIAMLRSFFDVASVSTHRDINYTYNSLPYLTENWDNIASTLKLEYHAYEAKIMSAMTYVNEGFNPHLSWRSITPFDAVEKGNGKSVYLLTHPHWWYKTHPFEVT